MLRLNLHTKPGRKPEWKWDKQYGKLTWTNGNGIDWWQYCTKVVLPKLIPFAQECEKDRPGTIIQKDGAVPHNSVYKNRLYNLAAVSYLLWVGNSLDVRGGLDGVAPGGTCVVACKYVYM